VIAYKINLPIIAQHHLLSLPKEQGK